MGMVKDAFTGDIISDEEYARRLASKKYGISIDSGGVEYDPRSLAGGLPPGEGVRQRASGDGFLEQGLRWDDKEGRLDTPFKSKWRPLVAEDLERQIKLNEKLEGYKKEINQENKPEGQTLEGQLSQDLPIDQSPYQGRDQRLPQSVNTSAESPDLPQFKGSLDNPYIMEPTKVAGSRLPLADSFIKPSYSGFGESRQKAIEESPPEAIEEKDSPRSLLSRMGGYAKDNPELIAQIAQLGGGLVANYAQGKAQEKADKTTGQRVARSNLISALSGGKIRPGVAEEVADSGGLLKTIGQVVQGGGKIAENEMGRRLAEETRLRGEKMEDEELVLAKKKLEVEATKALGVGRETEGARNIRLRTLVKTIGKTNPGLSVEGLAEELIAANISEEKATNIAKAMYPNYQLGVKEADKAERTLKAEEREANSGLIDGMGKALKDKGVVDQNKTAETAVLSMGNAVLLMATNPDEVGLLDISLIKALAKLQDPTSFVATDEFKVIADSIPMKKWIEHLPEKFGRGSILTPLGRKLVWQLATRNYSSVGESIERKITDVAKSYFYDSSEEEQERVKNNLGHYRLSPMEGLFTTKQWNSIDSVMGPAEGEITPEEMIKYGLSFNKSLKGKKGSGGDDTPSEEDVAISNLEKVAEQSEERKANELETENERLIKASAENKAKGRVRGKW